MVYIMFLQWLAENPGRGIKGFSPDLIPAAALGIVFIPRYADPTCPAIETLSLNEHDEIATLNGQESPEAGSHPVAPSETSESQALRDTMPDIAREASPPVPMVRTTRGRQSKITINAVIKWATEEGLRMHDENDTIRYYQESL
jgi:hypothetical protein